MIKIKVDWLGKKGLESLTRYISSDVLDSTIKADLIELGQDTANNMKDTIKISKKRHSFGSNLEDNINAEEIPVTEGLEVGVGKVSQLKTNAPYFEVLDVGGYVPYSTAKGAPLGSFEGDAPSSNASPVQNWERSGNKGFFMKPKKAIDGIDYIGKAIRNLDKELRIMMEKLGAKFVGDAAKASQG